MRSRILTSLAILAASGGCQLDREFRIERLASGEAAVVVVDSSGEPDPDGCINMLAVTDETASINNLWSAGNADPHRCVGRLVIGRAQPGYTTDPATRLEPGHSYSVGGVGPGYSASISFRM